MRFPFLESPYVELRLLTTQRHRLTVEVNRFKNRLQGVLDLTWPEFVEQWYALEKVTPIRVLERWPLPVDLVRASPRSVRALIRSASRNHVDEEKLTRLIGTARHSIALTQALPIRRTEIHQMLERWELVRVQMKEIDRQLTEIVEHCPAAKALTTVPEVSVTCAASIVAELGTPDDYEHPR